MSDFTIKPTTLSDKAWVEQFLTEHWGANSVVVHGVVYHPHDLPGFVAIQDGFPVGLVTYHISEHSCEIVTLNSIRTGIGIGTALINAVKKEAQQSGCTKLWLVTTNDNLDALGFYQKRGFVLVRLHPKAVERARKLKPSIPLYGIESIPIRDEIELEMQI